MRSARALAVFLPLLLAPVLPAQKAVAEPSLGLQFAPPKGWLELPGGHDRGATLRLFAAPRALASRGVTSHTPVLRVMFFAKGGDDGKDVVDGLPRATPFRSLDDFARRGLAAAEVQRTPQKVRGVDVVRVTAPVVGGERVLIGQTWPLDDGEAALCVEVLANQADKLAKEIDALLGSMEACPRVPAAPATVPWRADADWTKKDAAARSAVRRAWAQELVAAAARSPEAGYKLGKAKHWTVISAADPGFTKKAVAAAEAAREWLARRMPELTQEPPLPAVLRVFDSVDHYLALLTVRGDTREYDAERRELYVVNDRDNGGPTGYGPVLRAVLWHLLDDVDPAVLPALPRWFDHGCWELLRSSTFDGRKLEFAAGDVERGRIDYYRQKGEPLPALWGLIQEKMQPSPEDGKTEDPWGYTPECARLMRWLWLHDGQKALGKPSLVSDYVRAIAAAHDQLGPSPVADVAPFGLTPEQVKSRNLKAYAHRDALLVETNNRAVPFSVEQWQAHNEKWLAFNKAFK